MTGHPSTQPPSDPASHSSTAPGRVIDPTTQGLYARLCRVLDRQRELLSSLMEMSPHQHAAVESEDPESLIEVLGSRQGLIDELTELEPEVATLRREWAQRADADEVQRRAVRERFDGAALLAARVASADSRHLDELKRQRERLSSELASLARGKNASRAYEPPGAAPGARFQDHQA
ncbi:MAG: hypothetical protein JNL50_05265 [Phycisphaerae bacterium]|nr:hypothetical protein [Phycisphaerae bacterium]